MKITNFTLNLANIILLILLLTWTDIYYILLAYLIINSINLKIKL